MRSGIGLGRKGIGYDARVLRPALNMNVNSAAVASVMMPHLAQTVGYARGMWIGAVDYSYGPKHLTQTNTPIHYWQETGKIQVPYITFNGTTQRLEHADDAFFDILGTEAWAEASYRGLSMWAWIYLNASQTNSNCQIMGKYDTVSGNWRSYRLGYIPATKYLELQVSSDGTSGNTKVATGSNVVEVSKWIFVAGVYDPSTSMNLYTLDSNGDLEEESDVSSIPASIYNSSAIFSIFGQGGTNNGCLAGSFGAGAIYPHILTMDSLEVIYELTRARYGV